MPSMSDEHERMSALRERMVRLQLRSRGIADPAILRAFTDVPREAFLPAKLAEFAYVDSPLPIEGGQTVSQPYVVAVMLEALELRAEDRVLEIGTGSGYIAAILSRVAREVYTVERLPSLAAQARRRLSELGYDNVHVSQADGTDGCLEPAPYDAIVVAAGGPSVSPALLEQLAPGGRLVIPVGKDPSTQVLVRMRREGGRFPQEGLGPVRFVPLVGEHGWPPKASNPGSPVGRATRDSRLVSTLIREAAEPIASLDDPMPALVERMGSAKVVLLGESTHGTREFYRMRARITRELITKHGFNFVAVEADWPDAARVDAYVLGDRRRSKVPFTPFARFPTWMWRNEAVHEFVAWLRQHNLGQRLGMPRVGFHGLDLYSMFTSLETVLHYLDEVDPDAASLARTRYGTLTPWQTDPAAYGRAVLSGRFESSEPQVVEMLRHMLERRLEYSFKDGERFFDAAQNARIVANAERYYRTLYYGSAASWNLRDTHMSDTLRALLTFYGPASRAVVWGHNSHVGNALGTEMSARGELSVGQLCRSRYGNDVYAVGFSTDHGTVAAASDWGGPMEVKNIVASHPQSYEHLFHHSGVPAFTLPLREPRRAAVRDELLSPRLERAIGVIYRPSTELPSHYFQAALPLQFDELVWFDESRAVVPLPGPTRVGPDLPETYPWGV